MKRLIAVFLSALMLLMSFGISSFAASEPSVSGQRLETVMAEVVKALIGADENDEVILSDELYNAVKTGKRMTAGQVAASVSEYIFINVSAEEAEQLASEIADSATYSATVLSSGEETVYIAVRISEHPEIANLSVFAKTVEKMTEKQKDALTGKTENVSLMDYKRIAGELALHIAAAAILEPVKDNSETAASLFEMFDFAEIDITEIRLPSELFSFIGAFLQMLARVFG
ncbi:MAG: hypothetical protein ACI4XE_03310 [Acutalibacteraceae bacterium]